MCKLCETTRVVVRTDGCTGDVVVFRPGSKENPAEETAKFPQGIADIRRCMAVPGKVLLGVVGLHPEEGGSSLQVALTPNEARLIANVLWAQADEIQRDFSQTLN